MWDIELRLPEINWIYKLVFRIQRRLRSPRSLKVTVDKGVLIIINGIDKHEVGQFAARFAALKPPEPYKGKGIRYENEYVRKKEGKAAKAAAK